MADPHDDIFSSSPESPPQFYESEFEGGNEYISPEADDSEYVAPQERGKGEGSSRSPAELVEMASDEEDDNQD